jgi:hypothetical protein
VAKALVSPIPAPAPPGELAQLLGELGRAESWVQAPVAGAVPFLETVTGAATDLGEVVAVDADPPVALLGVAVIVLIFGAGLFIRAIGVLFSVLPWPLSAVAKAIISAGDQVIQYGIDVVEWMVRPLIQLAQALWHGLDKLLGLGLATAAQLSLAIYKHIQVIGPHQIAANDVGIAKAAAAAINDIVAIAPDYAMKAAKAAHADTEKLIQSVPAIIPTTAAGAMLAIATTVAANAQVVDECALPWCDTNHTTDQITKGLHGLWAGLLGAGLFCELVNNPAGAGAAISRDAGGMLAGLGGLCAVQGDLTGGALLELAAFAVSDPSAAAARLVSVVC